MKFFGLVNGFIKIFNKFLNHLILTNLKKVLQNKVLKCWNLFYETVFCGAVIKSKKQKALKKQTKLFPIKCTISAYTLKNYNIKKDNYTETYAINTRNMRKIKSKPCVLTMEHVRNYPEKLANILKVKTFQQVALLLSAK